MPSKSDEFTGPQCRIRVHSGKYFHLDGANIGEIDIVSIATALSRLCRFTGHIVDSVEIYTVAEHSILVSHILNKMGAPVEVQFQGLMHDASEAYLADIAAPFKGRVAGYYDVEELIMSRIRQRYLLTPFDARVKLADWIALFVEARQLMDVTEEELQGWQGYEEYGELSLKYHTPLECWLPSTAKVMFLSHFARLQDACYTPEKS